MPKVLDRTGDRYGKLTVLARAPDRRRGITRWSCRCDCGREIETTGMSLGSGNTTSCGCSRAMSLVKHGHAGRKHSATYQSWSSMIQRCTNPKKERYADYGGRGIAVCERWRSFENFLADMGERPQGTTLDRENGTKGYEPGNCRWAKATIQSRNRSCTRHVVWRGESMPLTEWAEKVGVPSRHAWDLWNNRDWKEGRVATVVAERYSNRSPPDLLGDAAA